jgi:hypothetical protein
MENPTGSADVFLSDAGLKVYVLNTTEKLLNTATPRVHSNTSRCLTVEVYTLNNGLALFNNLLEAEVALFPGFRLFSGAEMQKTGQKSF